MIDWAAIRAPAAVERLDYETLLALRLADFRSRAPEFDALVESEPSIKTLEAGAYRELGVRARINTCARALSLATATEDADIDVLAANLGAVRLPGESNADLRDRAVARLEKPAAGSRAAYNALVREADARIVDANAWSPSPCNVSASALTNESPEGVASAAVLAAITAALTDETRVPMGDVVTVVGPTIRPYVVTASITLDPGADPEGTLAEAKAALDAYCAAQHRLGGVIARSGISAALHRPGVLKAAIAKPAADLASAPGVAPWPTTGTAADYTAGTHPRGGLTVTLA